MSNMASKIKVVHYAKVDPKYEGKQVLALCGFRVPVRETAADKDRVSCFMCFEKLQASGQINE